MSKSDVIRTSRSIFGLVSSYLGAFVVALALLFGMLRFLLGVGIPSRIVTVFLVGLALVALGYGVVCNELSPQGRQALLLHRLILILLTLSIALIGRFGLILLRLVPEESVTALTTEIILGLIGIALAVVSVLVGRKWKVFAKNYWRTRFDVR